MIVTSQETQRLKVSEQVLQNICKSQDVAPWYRMLSKNQLLAISNLTNALRDDGEQGSTYRVHNCLSTLGISPLIKRRYLKKLISMCRGSDLAFLYFLWEGFYRCNRTLYTYNEQVLMSSIMHLDLEMTLHELDIILPPGHLSAKNQARLNKKNLLMFKSLQSQITVKTHRPKKNILPYFWRQPRPKQPNKFKSKTSKQNDVVVHFPFWPVGQKPNYRVSKANRWFASYQLNPVRSEIYRMVTDVIENYWQKSFLRVRHEEMVCKTHREILKQEQLIKDELIVKAHKHFLKLIDVTARENMQRKKRIIEELDKDIEECTQRWKKLEMSQHTETMLLKDNNLCERITVMTTPQNSKLKCLIGMDDYNPIIHLKTAATSTIVDITGMDAVSKCKSGQVSEPEEQCEHFSGMKDEMKTECPIHMSRPTKKTCLDKRRHSISFSSIIATDNGITKLSNNSKYFKSCRLHQPYMFNYHHTFHQCCTPLETIQVIHNQALNTLKNPAESTELLNNLSKRKICICREPAECTRDNVIQAIVKCAEDIWRNSFKSYTKVCTIPSRREVESIPKQNPCLTCGENDRNDKNLTFKSSYYDPNDSKLMETMLRDGMSILRKDPRFVFASFPDSHKTILMREWIKRRYGKTYTQKEIVATMKHAGLAFRAVINLQKDPPSVDLSSYRNEKTNYINRGKLDQMAKELKCSYNHALNEKLMQHTAVCWSFMGGQFWKGRYGTNNFYAYLPARNNDVLRVRPWNGTKRNMIDARRHKERFAVS